MDLQSFISWINTLEDLDNQYSEDNIRALWNKAKQYGEVATKRHANERQNFDDNEEHKDPIGCICRRHFIALLVRVAIDRYFVHGEESSAVDAVRHFLINVVFKTSFVPNINGDEFRQSKLYTSDCDHILKRFYMEIKSLFSSSDPIVIRIVSLRLLTSKCLTSILSSFSFLYTYSAPGLSGIWTNIKLV